MPRFSIVTPVYDPPAHVLREAIESVRRQTVADWELILIDDGSTAGHVRPVLRDAAAADSRIVVIERPANGGIVAASNDGLARAQGDYVGLLDHDDLLDERALEVVSMMIEQNPDLDFCYSDWNQLAPDGTYVSAFYKPDWSPERLRSQNYCVHFSVFSRWILDRVGGFREGFDGSQDYDLILRVTEQARTIVHAPYLLYHWRQLPTSVAGDPQSKPYAYEAGRRAIQEHCDRVGIAAKVEHGAVLGTYRLDYRIVDDPLVSIIIPTCGTVGRVWGLERCFAVEAIRSVLAHTSRRVELVLVVDDWTPADRVAAMVRAAGDVPTKVVWYDRPFNFSEKVNLGAVHAGGDLLLLLNDDVEVISEEFLDPMIGLARQQDVGAVGARLLFADGRLQHAGHLYNGGPYHIMFRWDGTDPGPFGMLAIARECIGVTAACLMVRREVFDDVGGLCTELPNNYNDVDFNLKLHSAGYRQIWTPHTSLYHFESTTRNPVVTAEESAFIGRRWAPQLHRDPYYNHNLEPNRDDWVECGLR